MIGELEALGNKYPFRVPPFFALVLRAFSVIEGIALTVDPDYAIVQECFPYIARRLLNDNDPRIKQALRVRLERGMFAWHIPCFVPDRQPIMAMCISSIPPEHDSVRRGVL